ncbi:MAG: PaaI family thioesterase [Proteobacteria bacterium]|nr:PaaI family thioesterase [Pseudomonadota bacterium]
MSMKELMAIFEANYSQSVAFDKHLGMTLKVNDAGDATYTLTIGPNHLTALDSAHGGVAAGMMDAALGVAALSYAISQGNFCATVEFKMNYLKQVKPGDILVAHGKVKHTGNRLIVSECDIREQKSGDLVASGLGTFTQYPMEKRQHILNKKD